MTYPRYFQNIITGNIYRFVSERRGSLYKVMDGITRFPSDYSERDLYPCTDVANWVEVEIENL